MRKYAIGSVLPQYVIDNHIFFSLSPRSSKSQNNISTTEAATTYKCHTSRQDSGTHMAQLDPAPRVNAFL